MSIVNYVFRESVFADATPGVPSESILLVDANVLIKLALFILTCWPLTVDAGEQPMCCHDFGSVEIPIVDAYFQSSGGIIGIPFLTPAGDILYFYSYSVSDQEESNSGRRMVAVYSVAQRNLLLHKYVDVLNSFESYLDGVADGPFVRLQPTFPSAIVNGSEQFVTLGDVIIDNRQSQGAQSNVYDNFFALVESDGTSSSSTTLIYLYPMPKRMESNSGFDGYYDEQIWAMRLTTLAPLLYTLPDGTFLQTSDRAPVLLHFDRMLRCLGCEQLDSLIMLPTKEFQDSLSEIENTTNQRLSNGQASGSLSKEIERMCKLVGSDVDSDITCSIGQLSTGNLRSVSSKDLNNEQSGDRLSDCSRIFGR